MAQSNWSETLRRINWSNHSSTSTDEASVSHQTVSRVINTDATVTPETRAKVEAAIAAPGFQPNAIARALAKGRTRTLACIAPDLTGYTFARIIEDAEVESRQPGHFLISSSAPDEATFALYLNLDPLNEAGAPDPRELARQGQ
ncbi:MAG TPA: LacI family DNA-binding transcriptional regulator [Anaerolineae bacterium]|nr:LacI family DNA-binding transcriptional regulator [Anaerolineae bacterium]